MTIWMSLKAKKTSSSAGYKNGDGYSKEQAQKELDIWK